MCVSPLLWVTVGIIQTWRWWWLHPFLCETKSLRSSFERGLCIFFFSFPLLLVSFGLVFFYCTVLWKSFSRIFLWQRDALCTEVLCAWPKHELPLSLPSTSRLLYLTNWPGSQGMCWSNLSYNCWKTSPTSSISTLEGLSLQCVVLI